jgi:hypothetical protein
MLNLTDENINECKKLVVSAQEKMREALDELRRYVRLSGDRNTEAYIVDHLAIMTSADHSFLSRDKNLDDVLEELRQYEDMFAMDETMDELEAAGWKPEDCTEDYGCPCAACRMARKALATDDWNTPDPAEDGMEPLVR